MAKTDRETLLMTQAEFARHRAVARSTVNEYKKKGWLVMTDEGLVNVVASEKLLADNLDPTRGGDRTRAQKPAAERRLSDAKAEEIETKISRQRLLLEKEAGRLVDKELTFRFVFNLARNAQESLMSIADRLAPLVAAESDPARVHEMLSDEIRLVCNNLAKASEESS